MNETATKTSRKPPSAGKGRPKGSVNKVQKDVKEMVLNALNNAGGQAYLTRQAEANPTAFLSLLGKLVPKDVKAEISGVESILATRLKEARDRVTQNSLDNYRKKL